MSAILGLIPSLAKKASRKADDDFVDRLSHRYTVIMLVVMAIVLSTKQYVGDPIQCWSPAYFKSQYVDYTNKICWVSNTYYASFDDRIPERNEPRKMIVYYQWIPIILLVHAILFYAPYSLWSLLNAKAGIDINSVVESAIKMHDTDNHAKTLERVVKHIDRFCGSFRKRHETSCRSFKLFFAKVCSLNMCGRKYGNYLVTFHLLTKLLYVANAIGQFMLLNAFLGHQTRYHLYGIDMLRHIYYGTEWEPSARFPRVTLCNFKIRHLGNRIHSYTVQCVLPINLFNEKIFIVVWFWLVTVCLIASVNFLYWVVKSYVNHDHVQYIKGHLRAMERIELAAEIKSLKKFVQKYLRSDGILVLRLMEVNSNRLVTSEVVAGLWDNFKLNKKSTEAIEEV